MFGCLKLRGYKKTYVVNKSSASYVPPIPSNESSPKVTPTINLPINPRPAEKEKQDDTQQKTSGNHQTTINGPTQNRKISESKYGETKSQGRRPTKHSIEMPKPEEDEQESLAININGPTQNQKIAQNQTTENVIVTEPLRNHQPTTNDPIQLQKSTDENQITTNDEDKIESLAININGPTQSLSNTENQNVTKSIEEKSVIVTEPLENDQTQKATENENGVNKLTTSFGNEQANGSSQNENDGTRITKNDIEEIKVITTENVENNLTTNQRTLTILTQNSAVKNEQSKMAVEAEVETVKTEKSAKHSQNEVTQNPNSVLIPLKDSTQNAQQIVTEAQIENIKEIEQEVVKTRRVLPTQEIIQKPDQQENIETVNNIEIEEDPTVIHVHKVEGVKFGENVELMIYDNDSDSDDGSNFTISKKRREGFREPVQIDDAQDIQTHPKTEQEALEIKKAFRANEFLQTVLKDDQLNTLVAAMHLREVEENEVIIQEGEPGNHLYVSAGGTYDVYVSQKKVNTFSDGRVFGELAILYNAKRMATIKAVTAGRIWVLHRSIYQRTLVQDAIRDYEEMLSFLRNVTTINKMDEEKLRKIANLLKKEFFKTDTVIVQQGDIGDKFYIIRAGSVTVTKKDEGKVAELSKGEYFGERALLQEDCRQATVIADAPGVECLTLTRAEFKEHFDDEDFGASKDDQKAQPAPIQSTKEPGEFADIQLDDLKRVETLGVGGFGRVELVQHKKDQNLTFALKYLKKIDMVQQGQVDHVFNEKNIQISCNSAFVVRMYKTFSDNKYLYFLMESCLGGDLWTFLQKQKGRHVGETAARFFAGCVLEALTYLHDRDYVYRDLKPENLIIDNNGYIKLTDFGFAKQIGRNGRTFTFAGTPEYVAPEIVYNRGHDKAVDYWAFGIFIFELLVGRTPFRSDDPSHMKTYNRILRGINAVLFPPHVSRSATIIIQKLCKAIPTERLGCQKNGVQDIRNHKWFQGFDWNKLRNRKLKAPFIPKLQSNTDTRNFEKFKPDDDIPPDELNGFDNFES